MADLSHLEAPRRDNLLAPADVAHGRKEQELGYGPAQSRLMWGWGGGANEANEHRRRC